MYSFFPTFEKNKTTAARQRAHTIACDETTRKKYLSSDEVNMANGRPNVVPGTFKLWLFQNNFSNDRFKK
jgi:hypothetical protein